MAERRTIIDWKTVEYSGLISLRGLYRLINNRLTDLGYKPFDDFHQEQVFEDGKQILITIKGEKKLSDYAKIEWKSKLAFLNCQEVIIEKEGQKVKMHKGSTDIKTLLYLTTDYDKSFEQNPFQYFLRMIIDKFVFKSYLEKAATKASKDYHRLESDIKRFLNLERFD
ncbi:MAG: hypothetical protein ACOCU6_00305 [Nanoarchaeota archaeon]